MHLEASKGSQAGQHHSVLMDDSVGTSPLSIPGYLKYPRTEAVIALGSPAHSGLGGRLVGIRDTWLNFSVPG